MSNFQLWQKARLAGLSDMVGNAESLAALRAIDSGFVLISGPIGTGKTSSAIAYVREKSGVDFQETEMKCRPDGYWVQHVHAVDFEVSDAEHRKVFFAWELPTWIIIDEAQDLVKRQWSKLKTIAPRERLTLILCTSDPDKIEPSLVDRCTHIRLGPMSFRELRPMIERACAVRGIPYDPTIAPACNKAGV